MDELAMRNAAPRPAPPTRKWEFLKSLDLNMILFEGLIYFFCKRNGMLSIAVNANRFCNNINGFTRNARHCLLQYHL